MAAGKGARCVVGPRAASARFSDWELDGPYKTRGKRGKDSYEYYFFLPNEDWARVSFLLVCARRPQNLSGFNKQMGSPGLSRNAAEIVASILINGSRFTCTSSA